MWYWLFKYVFMGPVLSMLGRPKVEGLEHVPHDGPAILASNHLAVADSLPTCRWSCTGGSPSWPSRNTSPGPGSRAGSSGGSTPWPARCRSIAPMPNSAQSALSTAERILTQDKLLGMYPEGTRSPDGRLYKGKTGLARLALETGVPVIPVAMIGTNVVNPPGSKMWRSGRVQVKFGKPMDFTRFEGLAGNRFIERAVIDEVMYELMRADRSGVRRPLRRRPQRGQQTDGQPRLVLVGPWIRRLGFRRPRRADPALGDGEAGDDDDGEGPPHVRPAEQLSPPRGRRPSPVLGQQFDGRPDQQCDTGSGERPSAAPAASVGEHGENHQRRQRPDPMMRPRHR